MSKFRSGAEAAKEASKSPQFARTSYLSMKDQEEQIVRFLTDSDDWLTVDQHNFVPTRSKPDDWPKESNWPNSMSATCRKTKLEDGSTLFDDCYICDHMEKPDGKPYRASGRTWALAVLREEVTDDDGEVLGFRDQTEEVTKTVDGKEKNVTQPKVVIVNQGYRNFFSILQGFAGRYGTILDRDYFIKREGDSTDTTYQIVPLDPLDADHPETGEEVRFDLREPAFMAKYTDAMPDLEEVLMEKASEEFYALFFDKTKPQPARRDSESSDSDSDEPEAKPKPTADVDSDEKVKALAERVKGYGNRSADDGETKTKGKAKAL